MDPHPGEWGRSRQALASTAARYRSIVEDQPDLVCRYLADGTLTFANEAYCAYFGLSRDDVVGKPYRPVVHPDDRPQVDALVSSLGPANPVVLIENRVLRADGTVRWTQWTNRALYDEQGQILEFQAAGRDITERKQAEEDAARLAAIVTSADAAIFSMTPDSVITSWNHAAELMFGYTAADAIGQPINFIIPDDRSEEGLGLLDRLRRGETVTQFETERLTKDGRLIPVSLIVSPIRDADGQMTGISKIARDITDRRRAERELQEREGRFRLMADHAPVLIWVADTHNRAIYFNKPWLDFTGLPLDTQVGDEWISLIHPDDRVHATGHRQEHFNRRARFTMEFRLRHQSGAYRWVQDTGVPLFLPDGTFNGYIGSCVDIDARKAEEDRTRRILEGISDAFSAMDRDWRFTYVNDHYLRLTGKTRDELLGRVCWEVFPEAERTVFREVAYQAVREQRPARVEDYYEPLGTWFETRLYPTLDGLITFSTDISSRKALDAARELVVRHESEARAAAEDASRMKDEFLAVVSHELRTPLNAILGWAQMLREGTIAADAVPKALDTIERNARVQARLVEDLLDVSRIVTGRLTLRVAPVNLGSVIQAAVEAVRPAATNRQIELRVTLEDPDTTVSGDAERLQQAIWNLLTNAVKFTSAGGRIDVRLSRSDVQATITVRDTGSGIPAAALPFIFDRFHQADSRTTRRHGGLGLGLTIVRYLAEAHGGTVRGESEGPGTGATFELALPITAATGRPVARGPAVAERPDLSSRRILVVDDDSDARELIGTMLKRCGAVVTTAVSVNDAIAKVHAAPPDVLVGDIGMPERDGYDLIRAIRSIPDLQHIPAIALTAYAGPQHREAALRAGYDAHFSKPIEPDLVCGTIAELCEARL